MGKRGFDEVMEDLLLELASRKGAFSTHDIAKATGINYRTTKRALELIYQATTSGTLQKIRKSDKTLWIWRPKRSYIEAKAQIVLDILLEKEAINYSELEKLGWNRKLIEKVAEWLEKKRLARADGETIRILEPWKYLEDYETATRKIMKALKKAPGLLVAKPIHGVFEAIAISKNEKVAIAYIPIATKGLLEKLRRKAREVGARLIVVADESEVEAKEVVPTERVEELTEKLSSPDTP